MIDEDLVGGVVRVKGFASSFQESMQSRICSTRTLTLSNVPRRTDCWVVIPDQVSIWFNHEDPAGAEGKWTCGFFASHASTSGEA